jgi:hypothetical protein
VKTTAIATAGGRQGFTTNISLHCRTAALFSPNVFLPFVVVREPVVIPKWRMPMKVSLSLLCVVLGGAVFAAIPAGAKQAAAENKVAPAAKKETKWQGNVVRIYKDLSQMDIRGGTRNNSSDMRKVSYDSSTAWTKGGKPGQQDDVKEGSFVIVLGQVDDKGVLHATRVDLRLPR